MVVLVNNQRRKHPVPVHQFRRNHPGRSATFLRVLAQRHFLSQTTLCHHKEAQRIVHRVLLFTIKIHSVCALSVVTKYSPCPREMSAVTTASPSASFMSCKPSTSAVLYSLSGDFFTFPSMLQVTR